jgi:hypothetical protein
LSENLSADAFDAARHLSCRATRKGHQENTARISAVDDQMGNTMRQRIRLAGTCTCDNQKRPGGHSIGKPDTIFHGSALFRIQSFQMRNAHGVSDVFLLFGPTPNFASTCGESSEVAANK